MKAVSLSKIEKGVIVIEFEAYTIPPFGGR
jgi:hypothetical protein